MSTKTKEIDSQTDSFVETELEFQRTEYSADGIAELVDVEMVDKEDIPEDYKDNYDNLSYNKYFVFDAKISDNKHVDLVLVPNESAEYYNIMMDWTNSSSISELTNKKIPIQNLNGDVYIPKDFRNSFEINDIKTIKKYVNLGFIEYNVKYEDWKLTNKYNKYKKRYLTTVSLVSIFVATLSVFITSSFIAGSLSDLFGIITFAVVLSLLVLFREKITNSVLCKILGCK